MEVAAVTARLVRRISFSRKRTKGQFCPAPRVQHILCVHLLILPDYLCNMWVQVSLLKSTGLSGVPSTLPTCLIGGGKQALV